MASTGSSSNTAAADADDSTTPATISNRGFDLVGFTMALDNLTLLVCPLSCISLVCLLLLPLVPVDHMMLKAG